MEEQGFTANHQNDPDLDSCENEPLAFSGCIQDKGALLVCDSAGAVTHYSENLQRFFQLDDGSYPSSLQTLFVDDSDYFKHRRQEIFSGPHAYIPGVISNSGIEGDLLVSEHDDQTLYEFEAHVPEGVEKPGLEIRFNEEVIPARCDVVSLLQRIGEITGFGKIMIYRFLPDASGEVVAEASDGSLGDYFGLRFPASDIPRNARGLYIDNPFRIIFDTECETVAVRAIPGAAEVPDLSTSTLRSVSPLHIEYLGNMGVRSSCSISIRVMGRLWGLVAMHSKSPLPVGIRQRVEARRLVDRELSLALMDASIEANHRRFNANAGTLERAAAQVVAATSGGDDSKELSALTELIDGEGLLVLRAGRTLRNDLDLDGDEIQQLQQVCSSNSSNQQFISDSLGNVMSQSDAFRQKVSGVVYLNLPGGSASIEIFWLRPEITREVDWAGKPEKLRREVNGEVRISPRQSFARWTAQSRGHAHPWKSSDVMLVSKLAAQTLSLLAGARR